MTTELMSFLPLAFIMYYHDPFNITISPMKMVRHNNRDEALFYMPS